jgi:hypothetical protein
MITEVRLGFDLASHHVILRGNISRWKVQTNALRPDGDGDDILTCRKIDMPVVKAKVP